jgi:hypothetical protein
MLTEGKMRDVLMRSLIDVPCAEMSSRSKYTVLDSIDWGAKPTAAGFKFRIATYIA